MRGKTFKFRLFFVLIATVFIYSFSVQTGYAVAIFDLSVEKSHAEPDDFVYPNGAITYTIIVENLSGDTAQQVKVENPIPAQTSIMSVDVTKGFYDDISGIWELGDLNEGDSETMVINVTVDLGATGDIESTAHVFSPIAEDIDENPDNDTFTVASTVLPKPLVDISLIIEDMTDNPDPVIAGQNVVYTITACNIGTATATGVEVINEVPVNTTFVAALPSQGGYDETTGTWDVGDLVSAGSIPADCATLDLEVNVTPGTKDFIENIAEVFHDDDFNDDNNIAVEDTIVLTPGIDLGITITAEPDPVYQGQDVTYTIVIENFGTDTLLDVNGRIDLDNRISSTETCKCDATKGLCNGKTDPATWQIAAMHGGTKEVAVMTCPVPPNAPPGIYPVFANILPPDPNPENNEDEDETEVLAEVVPPTTRVIPGTGVYFLNEINVSFICDDEVSGCKETLYKIVPSGDTCIPDTIWDGNPITVPGNPSDEKELCYHSIDNALNGEDIKSATYTFASSPVDHFFCYQSRQTKVSLLVDPKNIPDSSVLIEDQFMSKEYNIRAIRKLCTPADKNGEGIIDDEVLLEGYLARKVRGAPKFQRIDGVAIVNQFGTYLVDVLKEYELLIPTSMDPEEIPSPPIYSSHDVDNYFCYAIKMRPDSPEFPSKLEVSIDDPISGITKNYRVFKPRRLCVPASKNGEGPKNSAHLVCHTVKEIGKQNKIRTQRGLYVNNQFGIGDVDAIRGKFELCVPTTKSLPDIP
jgi:uncharacterized repeat protein (TIGR01451 family)